MPRGKDVSDARVDADSRDGREHACENAHGPESYASDRLTVTSAHYVRIPQQARFTGRQPVADLGRARADRPRRALSRDVARCRRRRVSRNPFKGITTNGEPVRGLFPVRSTGVSTEPVRVAAEKFLGALSEEQRRKTAFAVDDVEWRKWMNQSFYVRQGVGFNEMSEAQREAAFGLMRASLSAKGLKLSRDIMKLNHTLGELNHDNFVEYGEWLYWITVMGTPSASEPWGWQLDGHHLIINYFVLGDQVVMTPAFFGSEPALRQRGQVPRHARSCKRSRTRASRS